MKTSVIEVHDLLSVFGVDEVETRLGEVPGVESVTVNYAAREATVRYDESRLAIADIKSAVRQRGYEAAAPGAPTSPGGHKGHAATGTPPATTAPVTPTPKMPSAAPVSASVPSADGPKQDKAPSAGAPAGAGTASPDTANKDKTPDAASSTTDTGPKTSN